MNHVLNEPTILHDEVEYDFGAEDDVDSSSRDQDMEDMIEEIPFIDSINPPIVGMRDASSGASAKYIGLNLLKKDAVDVRFTHVYHIVSKKDKQGRSRRMEVMYRQSGIPRVRN